MNLRVRPVYSKKAREWRDETQQKYLDNKNNAKSANAENEVVDFWVQVICEEAIQNTTPKDSKKRTNNLQREKISFQCSTFSVKTPK